VSIAGLDKAGVEALAYRLQCPACLSKFQTYRKEVQETNTHADDHYRWYECSDCTFVGHKTLLNACGWDEDKAHAQAQAEWNGAVYDALVQRAANEEARAL